MSQPPNDLVFSGIQGSEVECDDLIRFIRVRALAEGKPDDDIWVAHLAASCFTKTALRWFEDLDEDVQKSWRLLRRAMLARWPDDAPDSDQPRSSISYAKANEYLDANFVQPNITAQPVSNSISGPLTGRIRVALHKEGTHFGYLSGVPDSDGDFISRQDKDEAMVVQITPNDTSHNIKIMKASADSDLLGLVWSSPTDLVDSLDNDNSRWATPTAMALKAGPQGVEPTLPTKSPHTGPIACTLWNVLVDGTIVLAWQGPKGAQYALHTEVIVSDREYGGILFVNSRGRQPIASTWNNFRNYKTSRARLIFEPI